MAHACVVCIRIDHTLFNTFVRVCCFVFCLNIQQSNTYTNTYAIDIKIVDKQLHIVYGNLR